MAKGSPIKGICVGGFAWGYGFFGFFAVLQRIKAFAALAARWPFLTLVRKPTRCFPVECRLTPSRSISATPRHTSSPDLNRPVSIGPMGMQ